MANETDRSNVARAADQKDVWGSVGGRRSQGNWSWHEEIAGTEGTATMTCTYCGQTRQASAAFTVTH